MKRYILFLLILFCCALTLQANEDKFIKNTILKYNYGIIKMAKTSETDFFKSFMKKEMVTKLMLWVRAWHDSNLVMLSKINDFRFGVIAYNDNNVTIKTLENWSYSYVDISTKKIVVEPVQIFYKMHYTLQKIDGDWIIIAIKHLQEEQFKNPNNKKNSIKLEKDKPKEKLN
ncbi:MAG: hypothetical protein L3J10_01775 [Sulfurimonas sp.]|nr:hypothetical protein [Sulfurimonas sp.]